MLYTVRYLERLQREQPEQYRLTFVEENSNLENLHKILALCEASRQAWAAKLKEHNEAPLVHEDILWAMYRDTKEEWLSPTTATAAAPDASLGR